MVDVIGVGIDPGYVIDTIGVAMRNISFLVRE
jgi:hypothetical protein